MVGVLGVDVAEGTGVSVRVAVGVDVGRGVWVGDAVGVAVALMVGVMVPRTAAISGFAGRERGGATARVNMVNNMRPKRPIHSVRFISHYPS